MIINSDLFEKNNPTEGAAAGRKVGYTYFQPSFNANRTNRTFFEDPEFGFRPEDSAPLCINSFNQNKCINWNPVRMIII